MALDIPAILAFNRGIISKYALSRVDVQRVIWSAQQQTNWVPFTLGRMSFRPGWKYTGTTRGNMPSRSVPFVFKNTDTARIELTDRVMRVWDHDDNLVSRRLGTTPDDEPTPPTITNGGFSSDLSGWTDADEAGAESSWIAGGSLSLKGTGFNEARRRQQISYAAHSDMQPAIKVVVGRGPVIVRIGGAAGEGGYFEQTLLTGTHSIGLDPITDFWIELAADRQYSCLVNSVAVEPLAAMELDTPWAESDLPKVRYQQSKNVIFVACEGYEPYRIERRSNSTWSVVKYLTEDGPFLIENLTNVTMTPSGLSGDISITSSRDTFRANDLGSLMRLTSTGQRLQATFTGEDQASGHIRVSGVGASQRQFTHTLTGLSGTGTIVTLQRSVANPDAWIDFSEFTTNATRNFNDGLDNQIIYYRWIVKTGEYLSGTIGLETIYAATGSITGVVRITRYNSPTNVNAVVLRPLGGTGGTTRWAFGAWSGVAGYPSVVRLYEGRLWWFGKGKYWGSQSDGFDVFDDEIEGNSAPIARSIAERATDDIPWALPLLRLIIGAEGAVFEARSSSLDEPLTAANINIKRISLQGCSEIDAAASDTRGYFIDAGARAIYEVRAADGAQSYGTDEATKLTHDLFDSGIKALALQVRPENRLHAVLGDGRVAVQVEDLAEDLRAWVVFETAGQVEDVVRLPALPGSDEDRVYYQVRREINGETVRYFEKLGSRDDIKGGALTTLVDSFAVYQGDPTSSIDLAHLEGSQVVVWADGRSLDDDNGDAQLFTVEGGIVALPTPASTIVAGLAYEAPYKSSKLAYAAIIGTSLTMKKRVVRLGLNLADTHARGLKYGDRLDDLHDLPQSEGGADVDPHLIWDEYDYETLPIHGSFGTDSRLCLLAQSPRPATVLAAPIIVEGHRNV